MTLYELATQHTEEFLFVCACGILGIANLIAAAYSFKKTWMLRRCRK